MAQWGVAGITPTTYTAEATNPNDDIAALLAAIQGGAGTGQVATTMLAQGLSALSSSVKKKHRFNMSSADTELLRLIAEEKE